MSHDHLQGRHRSAQFRLWAAILALLSVLGIAVTGLATPAAASEISPTPPLFTESASSNLCLPGQQPAQDLGLVNINPNNHIVAVAGPNVEDNTDGFSWNEYYIKYSYHRAHKFLECVNYQELYTYYPSIYGQAVGCYVQFVTWGGAVHVPLSPRLIKWVYTYHGNDTKVCPW